MKAKRAKGWKPKSPKPKPKGARPNGAGRADVRAAILHLRRAEADYLARIRDGRLRTPDRAHTLLTLALAALEDPEA
jgi:hypothetical protein